MRLKRFIQLVTGVHKIHDIYNGYGYKLPFCNITRFNKVYENASPSNGRHWFKTKKGQYHDCTITGVY